MLLPRAASGSAKSPVWTRPCGPLRWAMRLSPYLLPLHLLCYFTPETTNGEHSNDFPLRLPKSRQRALTPTLGRVRPDRGTPGSPLLPSSASHLGLRKCLLCAEPACIPCRFCCVLHLALVAARQPDASLVTKSSGKRDPKGWARPRQLEALLPGLVHRPSPVALSLLEEPRGSPCQRAAISFPSRLRLGARGLSH